MGALRAAWAWALLSSCTSVVTRPESRSVEATPGSSSHVERDPERKGDSRVQRRAARRVPPSDPVGTDHPVLLVQASPDARWVVYCQARSDDDESGRVEVRAAPSGALIGDSLTMYLTQGSGPGEVIEDLLAADPTGRYLVLRRQGQVQLLDSERGTTLDLAALGADTRADAIPHRQHRTLSFDRSGQKLLYVRGAERHPKVVVRDLTTGRETLVDPGAGKVWRAELDRDGRWITLLMITEDTSGNGRLGWPVPEADVPTWRCRRPIARHQSWEGRGDHPETRVARASGGPAKSIPGFVAPWGESLLVRGTTETWYERSWEGARVRLGLRPCAGRVTHGDPERRLVVVACEQKEGPPRLEVLGAAPPRQLALDLVATAQAVDHTGAEQPRLLPIYPGSEARLLDLETLTVHPLLPRDLVLLTHEALALVYRAGALFVYDAAHATVTPLDSPPGPLGELLTQDTVAIAHPRVVDLAARRYLGNVWQMPLALSRDGRVLAASGQDGAADQVAVGPLEWVVPQ